MDGACRNNPGPGGWAYVLSDGSEASGCEAAATSNRMELRAAIEALAAVEARCCAVRLWTDSGYVAQGISRWLPAWRDNCWRTAAGRPLKNEADWRALDELLSRVPCECRRVKRGSCRLHNRADFLAKAAIEAISAPR